MTASTQRRSAFVPESAAIRPLELPELLLLPTQRLVMQEESGLLALLSLDGEGRPALLVVQQFTASEWAIFAALVEQAPDYCPYEVLLAHFTYTSVTEQRIERLRAQLYEAKDDGTWDALMRPVRNVLSRVRLKLRPFGIGIVSLLELGYLLVPLTLQAKGASTHAPDPR